MLALTHCVAQNLSSNIQLMKNAYAGSGSIVALGEDAIVIEPKMPSPVCGLPLNKDGKTAWSYYTFPLSSITVPLAQVEDWKQLEQPFVAAVEQLIDFVTELGDA